MLLNFYMKRTQSVISVLHGWTGFVGCEELMLRLEVTYSRVYKHADIPFNLYHIVHAILSGFYSRCPSLCNFNLCSQLCSFETCSVIATFDKDLATNVWSLYSQCLSQCCGSGSAWNRIILGSWIRIRNKVQSRIQIRIKVKGESLRGSFWSI